MRCADDQLLGTSGAAMEAPQSAVVGGAKAAENGLARHHVAKLSVDHRVEVGEQADVNVQRGSQAAADGGAAHDVGDVALAALHGILVERPQRGLTPRQVSELQLTFLVQPRSSHLFVDHRCPRGFGRSAKCPASPTTAP
eukprot:TRINITY_DN34456_c0_g1_i1.p2 TRINITY_DN34456_c0_g1~~TRINITY_DN34456_c0_g1_i1.p2  ORF type:complete len:140 (+),score=21.42 TRINITY_DN34456_c0_g1_i1:168-587(+)